MKTAFFLKTAALPSLMGSCTPVTENGALWVRVCDLTNKQTNKKVRRVLPEELSEVLTAVPVSSASPPVTYVADVGSDLDVSQTELPARATCEPAIPAGAFGALSGQFAWVSPSVLTA